VLIEQVCFPGMVLVAGQAIARFYLDPDATALGNVRPTLPGNGRLIAAVTLGTAAAGVAERLGGDVVGLVLAMDHEPLAAEAARLGVPALRLADGQARLLAVLPAGVLMRLDCQGEVGQLILLHSATRLANEAEGDQWINEPP